MTTLNDACSIFKVLDRENNGYITVDRFVTSFHEYYNNDDGDYGIGENTLSNLISKMQPDSEGRIYFDNFLLVFQQVQPEKSVELKSRRYSQYSIKRFLSANSYEEPSLDEIDSLQQSLNTPIPEDPEMNIDYNHKTDTNSYQSDSRLPVDKTGNNQYPEFDDISNHSKWSKGRLRITSSCKNLLESHSLLPCANSRTRDLFSAGASPRGSDIHPGVLSQQIGSNFDSLQLQMKRLEQKLNVFHSDQYDLGQKQSVRLKEENKVLVQRINNLEDNLKELEERADLRISEEKKDFKQKLTRAEEEKHRELESVQNRLFKYEGECAELSLEIRRHRDESERLKAEKHVLTERLTDSDVQISNLQEDFDRLKNDSKVTVDNLKKEKDKYERILIELNDQYEGSEGEPQLRIQTMNKLSQRHKELEELLLKLKEENKQLLDQLVNANTEFQERSAKEKIDLLNASNILFKELDHCSKDELMDTLAKTKDSNFRLRDYIEKIIVKVMDKQPSLLEVKSAKK